ncbi:hypothetical protein Aduo_010305 [Ancylostoma duodenale]
MVLRLLLFIHFLSFFSSEVPAVSGVWIVNQQNNVPSGYGFDFTRDINRFFRGRGGKSRRNGKAKTRKTTTTTPDPCDDSSQECDEDSDDGGTAIFNQQNNVNAVFGSSAMDDDCEDDSATTAATTTTVPTRDYPTPSGQTPWPRPTTPEESGNFGTDSQEHESESECDTSTTPTTTTTTTNLEQDEHSDNSQSQPGQSQQKKMCFYGATMGKCDFYIVPSENWFGGGSNGGGMNFGSTGTNGYGWVSIIYILFAIFLTFTAISPERKVLKCDYFLAYL